MSDEPGHGHDDSGGHDPVGSVSEEAAKLLGALSGWAKDHGDGLGEGLSGMAGSAAQAFKDAGDHIATEADECKFCPVCRTIHLVRDLSPEVKTHLAVASASLMQAAAALLATAVPDQGKSTAARGDDIEPIDLDEDWPED